MVTKSKLLGPATAILLGAMSVCAAAQVKDANEVSATDGVLLPSSSITEVNDGLATAVNPANLGFLESWQLQYVGAWIQTQQRLTGQGHGFFFGAPLGPVGIGISVEPLIPPTEVVKWQGLGHRTRFSIALGWNIKRIIGLGIAYRTFWFDDFAPVHTMDLSLSIRPSNYIALSFVFSDVNSPRFEYRYWSDTLGSWSNVHNHRAPRRFNVGLTLRPMGNDRLAVGSELRYMNGEADDQMETGSSSFSRTDVMAFLSGMPVNGLQLKLRFLAEGLNNGRTPDLILDGAIGVDLPNFGVGASFHGQVSPDGRTGYQGTSWYATIHGDKAPSLPLPRPIRSAHVVVLDIEKPLGSYTHADLVATFERMTRDPSVDMVLLRPDKKVFSLAQAEEIREDIARLQAASKKVICYLTEASTAEYLACAGADHVWINPAGIVRMAGLSMTTYYLGDIAEKVGVEADMVRIGKYKSAPEVYKENKPSEATTEAVTGYLGDVYASLIEMVQTSRGFKTPEAARLVVEGGPFTATEALAHRLVDESIPKDLIEARIFDLIGNHVYFDTDYPEATVQRRRYIDAPAVAVVHIDGDLVDGESMTIPLLDIKTVGAKTITQTLRRIGRDSRIRAVVLRINSPGGSAMASDILWREIASLRREKPVVVSMGSIAASGGYYIASAANKVYTDAMTLTGSIGIYYGKADLSTLLSKVGINPQTYKMGEHADMDSWTRPYTEEERSQLMRQIAQFYNLFLQRIVDGRNNGLTTQAVDAVGQGRIWSGTDAHYHKLADEIGGYADALRYARSLVGSKEDIPVFHYPARPKSLLMQLVSSMSAKFKEPDSVAGFLQAAVWKPLLSALVPFAAADPLSPRARLPFATVEP